jgi:putative transposon-encoded protein
MARRSTPVTERARVTVEGVEGFFEKTVTTFGTGAKVDCPKQYLGRAVYVIVRRPDAEVSDRAARRRG